MIGVPALVVAPRFGMEVVFHGDQLANAHFRIVEDIPQFEEAAHRVLHRHFFRLNHFVALRQLGIAHHQVAQKVGQLFLRSLAIFEHFGELDFSAFFVGLGLG